jgi:hypothetical protein
MPNNKTGKAAVPAPILQARTDGVLTITLNRPDRLNAFTDRMMTELVDAFDRADADDAVRAVIVTGAGRAFCAGADLAAGRIDGMFVEELAGLGFLGTEDGASFMKLEPIYDDAALGAGAGAMMRTGDERLARINEGIRAVYADGTFAALEDKWLPEGATIAADHLWVAQ